MARFILLILLSIFLLPIMQNTANAQSITSQNGSTNKSTLASTPNNFMNNSNTLAGQGRLLQNNPGYAIYIPGTGFLKNTTNNSGNESLNNVTNGAGQASIDARLSMSNDSDKGGLLQNNPGYAIYIPGTGFLKNTTNNSGNASNIQSNTAINPNNTNATLGNGSQ
jgi:hypothetical protein